MLHKIDQDLQLEVLAFMLRAYDDDLASSRTYLPLWLYLWIRIISGLDFMALLIFQLSFRFQMHKATVPQAWELGSSLLSFAILNFSIFFFSCIPPSPNPLEGSDHIPAMPCKSNVMESGWTFHLCRWATTVHAMA